MVHGRSIVVLCVILREGDPSSDLKLPTS
jgi:hypothetical protein